LVKDGKVVRGPVSISSGGNGEETPTGTFHVLSKDKDHKSQEFKIKSGPKKGQPAPMPWSVFFAPGGVAFHSGDPDRDSAGCIHLEPGDAQAWFSSLQVGDEVQVFQNSDGDDNDNGDGDDKSGDDDDDHGGDDDDHGGDDDHGNDD
jgi:lipoprotein-anchoring transpeptidase ErfK/SrfK